MVKQGASAAKPPAAAPAKEGSAPFVHQGAASRSFRGARGNSQGRQSIGGTAATAAPASGPTAVTAAAVPPQAAARPERYSAGGKEEEMMGGRIRVVSADTVYILCEKVVKRNADPHYFLRIRINCFVS